MRSIDSNHKIATRRRWRIYVSLSFGLASVGIIVTALVHFQWLRYDAELDRIVVQRPPLYLQEPGFERTGHRYLYDPQFGWRNIPGWRASTGGRALTINSLGMRGPEITSEKPAGTKRVLVLGDSYAWGYGVADRETFSWILEQMLNKEFGVTTPWQVLNSGVSGWGTDQQFLYLRKAGMSFSPDVVVVAFFTGNDFTNNSATSQYSLNKPVVVDDHLTVRNTPVPRPGQHASPALELELGQQDEAEQTSWIIRGIADVCQQRNCQLVLMKFGGFLAPGSAKVRETDLQFSRAIELVREPLMILDLDQAFDAHDISSWEILRGNDDGHWNARGHQEVARLLADFLRANELVP